jgi:hypothetical protein
MVFKQEFESTYSYSFELNNTKKKSIYYFLKQGLLYNDIARILPTPVKLDQPPENDSFPKVSPPFVESMHSFITITGRVKNQVRTKESMRRMDEV